MNGITAIEADTLKRALDILNDQQSLWRQGTYAYLAAYCLGDIADKTIDTFNGQACIYLITIPDDPTPIYIGSTVKGSGRLREHTRLQHGQHTAPKYFLEKFDTAIWRNWSVIFIAQTANNKEQLRRGEVHLITKMLTYANEETYAAQQEAWIAERERRQQRKQEQWEQEARRAQVRAIRRAFGQMNPICEIAP